MNNRYYGVKCKCPHCGKGEVLATSRADIETSVICNRCQKAYVVNWLTLKAVPAQKQKRQ